MSDDASVDFYESSPEFVRTWSDARLTISSGLWQGVDGDDGDDLDRAQTRKLELIADLAELGPGGRVLDIGCGYGGLLDFAVRRRKAGNALGVTTSFAQARHIKSMGDPAISVLHVDFWDLPLETGGFDAVVAVQSLENVLAGAPPELTGAFAALREMFRRVHALTAPGGRFAAEVCVAGPNGAPDVHRQFEAEVLDNSQPGTMPRVGDLLNAAEGLWEPLSVTIQSEDFVRTLDAGASRLASREAEARRLGGDDLYRATCETVRGTTAAVRGGIMRVAWIAWKRTD
ncbi:SAM-dependent methyltransferase [Streptomyces sp. NPDC020917]|uniref:SAM-dependent methyltransferase n=1 Tax=Streptomyces sp. NPDC020917 TaxID=3365102 RepID=UPI0037B6E43F